jgi:hypothetical protein
MEREAFPEAVAALKAGSAAALVIRDLARIARDMHALTSSLVALRDILIPLYLCGESEPFSFASPARFLATVEPELQADARQQMRLRAQRGAAIWRAPRQADAS